MKKYLLLLVFFLITGVLHAQNFPKFRGKQKNLDSISIYKKFDSLKLGIKKFNIPIYQEQLFSLVQKTRVFNSNMPIVKMPGNFHSRVIYPDDNILYTIRKINPMQQKFNNFAKQKFFKLREN